MGYGLDELNDCWDACDDEPQTRYNIMEPTYRKNASMKVGSILMCPSCEEFFKKKSYQQKFCRRYGNKCKDYFWNSHPDRISRTEDWNR